ncbi:hypothetical protein STANM309S_04733 [Streptomyces tanashiensis]
MVGGGYVGMYTALRLQRQLGAELRAGTAEIVVVTPEPYMTYQPFLPEAAAGSISPRHVVVPLRRVLDRCRIVIGEVGSVDHAKRTATLSTLATEEEGTGAVHMTYDELVIAPGSVSRTLPVPGLADHGIGFKTVEEAIGLRNHVIEQMDIASSTRDPALRDAALTFVFVGGGYAGVEALAELEDMARYTARYYHNVKPEDLRWVLVEASDRILPEVGEEMGRYAVRELRGRNIDVRLGTRLESCEDRVAVLSDGTRLPTRTVVWTAGVKPAPVLAATDLPLNERGRLRCTAQLAVEGAPHAWAAGDAAAVPDVTAKEAGKECAPNAQHAVRQAKVLAENIAASLRGQPLKEYAHAYVGLRRLPRPPQGSRPHLRAQAQGISGLVHAPRLPPQPGPHLQPQGPGPRRMDLVRPVQTGDRLPRLAGTPQGRIRTRRLTTPRRRRQAAVLTSLSVHSSTLDV